MQQSVDCCTTKRQLIVETHVHLRKLNAFVSAVWKQDVAIRAWIVQEKVANTCLASILRMVQSPLPLMVMTGLRFLFLIASYQPEAIINNKCANTLSMCVSNLLKQYKICCLDQSNNINTNINTNLKKDSLYLRVVYHVALTQFVRLIGLLCTGYKLDSSVATNDWSNWFEKYTPIVMDMMVRLLDTNSYLIIKTADQIMDHLLNIAYTNQSKYKKFSP